MKGRPFDMKNAFFALALLCAQLNSSSNAKANGVEMGRDTTLSASTAAFCAFEVNPINQNNLVEIKWWLYENAPAGTYAVQKMKPASDGQWTTIEKISIDYSPKQVIELMTHDSCAENNCFYRLHIQQSENKFSQERVQFVENKDQSKLYTIDHRKNIILVKATPSEKNLTENQVSVWSNDGKRIYRSVFDQRLRISTTHWPKCTTYVLEVENKFSKPVTAIIQL